MDFVKITLAAARVNAGLSQKEAANALDVSNKTLCSWENYRTYPDVDMVAKICALYAVPYEQIIFCP